MRWIFRIVGALAVVAVLAVAALFMMPTEKIAKLLTDQFEKSTGRSLALSGEVRPSLWPELGVTTGAVTLANANWSDGGPMLQADGLSVGVNTAALWGGDIRITRIEAIAPNIRLERHSDGRANWELGGSAPSNGVQTSSLDAVPSKFSLERLAVTNGQVTYVDHGSGARSALGAITGTAKLDDLNGPGALEVSADYRGQLVQISATVDALQAFLGKGTSTKASGKIGGSSFAFNGAAGLAPLAIGGAIDLDLSDQTAVFGLIGSTAPELPLGFGQRVKIAGDMTFTDAGLTLRNSKISLDQNDLTGALDASFDGARPKVTASLSAGDLDFAALAPAQSYGSGSAPAANSGWSKDTIDVSALHNVDAAIALAANSIDLGVLKLGATRTKVTLDAGRAVADLTELNAYGGALTGRFVLSARGGLSARATMSASGVAVQPLLTDLAGYDRLIADGDLNVNLLAVGNSMDALMRSLDGTASMNLGKGELLGLDLVGMLRNLDPNFVGTGQKTIFDGLSNSFTFGNGFARNDDLLLDARLVKATGAGRADLGAQTLDYRLTAKLLEGQTNGGLGVPILVTGPWSAPKFRLDLEALAKQELGDEIEEVKEKAQELILNKIEEETGVSVETLGEVEDALKEELGNRVEDAIKNEVGNALNNLFNR